MTGIINIYTIFHLKRVSSASQSFGNLLNNYNFSPSLSHFLYLTFFPAHFLSLSLSLRMILSEHSCLLRLVGRVMIFVLVYRDVVSQYNERKKEVAK